MVKGHVQIELHNHRTGLRDRIEQDNLVTNAVDKAISTMIGRGQAASTFMPLCTNLLGGVMLFEEPLTSSATNISFPTSNTVIGYAGQTVNTSSKDMGSINEIESGPVTNGYMNVWDFSTAQANGTISAMSLTNYRVGNGSLWNPSLVYTVLSGNDTQLSALERDSRYITYVYNGKIYKILAPVNTYTVTDSNNLIGSAEDTGRTVPSTANNNSYRIDGSYLYYSVYANNALTIYKYNASDSTLVNSIVISPTPNPSGSIEFTSLDLRYNSLALGNIFVKNGKIYIFNHKEDYAGIFVFDAANGGTQYCEKMYKIQDPDIAYYGDSAISYITSYNSWPRIYVTDDDTIWTMLNVKSSIHSGNPCYFKQCFIKEDNGSTIIKVYGAMFVGGEASILPYIRYDGIHDIAYYNRYAAATMISGNYLGTICNLNSPIEKTSTSSMKVKYTLTNV